MTVTEPLAAFFMPLALVAGLALGGCTTARVSPQLPVLDATPCHVPPLTVGQDAKTALGVNRTELKRCALRHKRAVALYEDLRRGI